MNRTHRYNVTLQHRESRDFQTWSVLAAEAAEAVAVAQHYAGGCAWEATAIEVKPIRRAA